ncbi:MAG: SDR family oxidoreductase [Chitinophagaceae bacterium]|nr:SDR family oxidoreductase [Chitinophagaceae bacterium]
MKILLTGANGFVGAWLAAALLDQGEELLATGSGDCRLPFTDHPLFHYLSMELKDPASIKTTCEGFCPELIIHSGAMSRPDECELNPELAYSVNVNGTRCLLEQAERVKSRFIFLSTDFVFDGLSGPFKEDDQQAPVNYYGQTKYEAEKSVMGYGHDWAIVRTILVYGNPIVPRSYLLSIVEGKLKKGESYSLVNDQFRTPTYVKDLVSGIIAIVNKNAKGIFHLSGEDRMTPYEMGMELAKLKGLDTTLLKAVTAEIFKEPALRPKSTSFMLDKAKNELDYQPHSFNSALREMNGY